ncbi:MAG: pitrilysin family protein [bacterium]|nr:pitrilysin family protein [Candidatus Sumerlaeota bacterium]
MITQRFESGLTVIARHVPNRVVTLDAWVNAGSANEDDELNGVSHFLEHMLFKGTAKYGVGELDKAVTGVGGVWNAGTSKDYTHYYVTVAAPFVDTALDAISDMLQNPLIDSGEFDSEKRVILEEYRLKQDNPWGALFDELYEASFVRGPYRRSVIGTFESVSGLTRGAMVDYFERYYAPANMTFIVVGDIEPELAVAKTRAAFQGFNRPHRPLAARNDTAEYASGVARVIPRDVQETYAAIAFPAPAIREFDDMLALDVAATILGEGRSSRLYRALKEDMRLVNLVAAGFPTHRQESIFYVGMTLERGKLDAARTETLRLVRNMAGNAPPTEAELAKAKRIIRNSYCFATETNTGQSGVLGYYQTLMGSADFVDKYLQSLDAVTRDNTMAVVRRYLSREPNMVVVEPK